MLSLSTSLGRRLLREVNPAAQRGFVGNLVWRGLILGRRRHRQRLERGEVFPLMFFISVTNECNLNCTGCCALKTSPPHSIGRDALHRIVSEAEARGTHLFGLVGGEPFLHPGLLSLVEAHPRSYFLVITNGTLVDGPIVHRLSRLSNVAVMVSLEGMETATDRRRGRNTFVVASRAVQRLRDARLVFGVGITVTSSNLREVTSKPFVDHLLHSGALFAWYFIYRPMGKMPCEELMLSPDLMVEFRQRLSRVRRRAPLVLIDNYWDAEPCGYCPAGAALAYHINARGQVEVCPPLHFSAENALGGNDLFDTINGSGFLRGFRDLQRSRGGCPLLEYPDSLERLLASVGATDTADGFGREEIARLKRLAVARPEYAGWRDPAFYRFARRMLFGKPRDLTERRVKDSSKGQAIWDIDQPARIR